MNASIAKQNTLHDQLTGYLQLLSSILSTNWKEAEEKHVLEKVLETKKLLENANVDVSELEKRLKQCDCFGKKVFCMLSVIALECSLFLDALYAAHEEKDKSFHVQSEFFFSIKQKEIMSQIVEFIVLYGLLAHLEFQISILLPRLHHRPCKLSKQDFFNICRNLISSGKDRTIRNILSSKHLLALLASFIQLSYSPSYSNFLSLDEVKFSRKCLSSIIVQWSQLKDVVKCLFIMQGSSSRSNPKWLNKACGVLLSKCLLRQHGVTAVITSLQTTLASDMGSWKKVEIASKILSTPSHLSSEEQYYANICEQILGLLQQENIKDSDNDSEQLSSQILVATVFSLNKGSFDLTSRFFFNKVLCPLDCFYVECAQNKDKKSISENCSTIAMCIDTLSKVFVAFKHPYQDDNIKTILLPHFNAFFALYVWSRDRVDHIRTLIKQLLVKCIQAYNSNIAACLLLSLCGIIDESVNKLLDSIHKLKRNIDFASDEGGEIIIKETETSRSAERVIDDQNKKVAAVMEVAAASQIKKIISQIFILLCKHIESLSQNVHYERNENELLTSEESASLHLQYGESQLLAYALLTTLCEECDPRDLLEDIDQVASFIEILLTRISSAASDSPHHAINKESLKLCYAVLGLCLLDVEAGSQSRCVKSLVPLLQKLSTLRHLSSEDREIASDLAIAIATHCAYSDVSMESFSQTFQDQIKNLEAKYSKCQDSLSKTELEKEQNLCGETTPHVIVKEDTRKQSSNSITEIPSTSADSVNTASLKQADAEANVNISNSLHEAIQSLYDPCPSVRAAGLRYIATSMKTNVKEVTEQSEKMSEILLEVLLKENDSFVYLSAIQAVVETIYRAPMITKNSRALFDRLVDDYDTYIQSPDGDVELKISKLGEVLVRIVEKLGDLADYQSFNLLPVLLRGSRHSLAPVRCSCISNLAGLCPLLRHKLTSCRFELSECICATVLHDDDVTVRRAAVHLMRKLIDSYKSNLLQMFSESMKKFYSVMKWAYQNDTDHVVQLHAQLALEGLDDVMRDLMFREPVRKSKTMKKKITVLP